MARAVLYDSTLCVGCRACEEACAKRWNLPYNDAIAREEQISERKLTTVVTHGERYSRRLCMHCGDPACASVCPVGALEKTQPGPVVYHEDRCMGCRYCMLACPFQVPSYTWSERPPKVRKCDMCAARQFKGEATLCSEACPTGATITGERETLLAEARRRMADKPDGYHPHVYGFREVGGTSVLMLSAVPFDQLALNTKLPEEALPPLTWRVLNHVPDIAALGSVLLGGIYWITHRREEVGSGEARLGGRTARGARRKESR